MFVEQAEIAVASLFPHRDQAQYALARLQQEGIPESSVTVLSRLTLQPDSFRNLNLDAARASALHASLEAGAVLLAVVAPKSQLARVREILGLPQQNRPEALPAKSPGEFGGPFVAGTFELSETIQQPVVHKLSHVVEEVLLTRDTTTRTVHLHDTLHRTEVEVEPLPSASSDA